MNNNEIVDFIEVFETDLGWYWRAKSANGKKVAIGGEPFSSEAAARDAAADLFPAATGDIRRVEKDG